MTHAALTNAALLVFLVLMTVLLVTFVGAVIAAPPALPASPVPEADAPLTVQALAPPAARASSPPPPLPRRRPLATASPAGTASWPADADAASPNGAPMPAYTKVDRLRVSGGPPWSPAPKPPGPDPWAAEDFSPGRQLWQGQRPASPNGARPTNSEPPPGTRAVPDDQTRYPRHARERLSARSNLAIGFLDPAAARPRKSSRAALAHCSRYPIPAALRRRAAWPRLRSWRCSS